MKALIKRAGKAALSVEYEAGETLSAVLARNGIGTTGVNLSVDNEPRTGDYLLQEDGVVITVASNVNGG